MGLRPPDERVIRILRAAWLRGMPFDSAWAWVLRNFRYTYQTIPEDERLEWVRTLREARSDFERLYNYE